MNTTIKNIELILTSEYSTKSYVEFVQNVFSSMRLIAHNNYRKEFSNFSSHIMGYTHIGEYITSDSKKVAIFSVELKNAQYVQNSRSTQRSYAKKLIEAGNCDAALVAFYTTGDVKWRISFVRLDYEMKIEHGKLKTSENITPAKRYSFLVGKDEPCHTAIDRFQQFIVSGVKHSLDEIEEAFSVERVTKEFFELYCEKFYQLQEYLDSNEDFVEESKRCGFTSEQFAKKLMGQIVFLYFLQKKGWLGVNVWPQTLTEKEYKNLFFVTGAQGRIIKEHLDKIYVPAEDGSYRLLSRALDDIPDEDEEVIANHITQILVNGNEESRRKVKTWGAGSKKFLRTIFEFSQKHKGHFYEYYLEPLFYNTLNKNRGNMGYCPFLHCRVPFLSGGLFDPLDGYDWRSNHFDIPDKIFSNKKDENDRTADGILDIFDRYNFTMSEDEPLEREVAIDPEMLGKIFENLLEVRDRKSKGAFYTPREIVHYMCQESLVNYLVRKTGISETALRDFILYGDFMKDEDTDTEKRKGNGGMYISEELFKMGEDGKPVVNRLIDVDKALATVRVADPAVGSGAFPLGMVNEIVRARQNITAYISIGMNANSKRLMYKNERSPYMLKYQAIRDSIFAVDIEPSAVDIAQLRLWLSLVIDDEVTPDAANDFEGHRNPLPLPNLECNIICGNSLIDEFMGIKLVNASELICTSNIGDQLDVFGFGYDSILIKFLEAQEELFKCDEPNRKLALKSNIQALKDMIISHQLQGVSEEILTAYEATKKMSSKPYILWHLDFARVFRENGGFDIVIGNPPYVSAPTQMANPVLAANRDIITKSKRFSTLNSKWDLYVPFMELGIQLLRTNGSFSMIVPYPLTNQIYAKKLRELFTVQCDMWELVDLQNVKVFDATVQNCIPFVSKSETKGVTAISRMAEGSIRREFLQPHTMLIQDTKTQVWCLVNEQREIDKYAKYHVLGDYCYLSYGLRPNSDEKTAKGEFVKKDLISDVEDEIPRKPYIEAKDTEAYGVNRVRFLEYGTERSPGRLTRPTFPELYIHPKLMFNVLGELRGAIDEDGIYVHNHSLMACVLWKDLAGVFNNSISGSTKKFSSYSREEMEDFSQTIDLYFLLAIMNSKKAATLLTNIRSGDYHIYPEHVRNIPIPPATRDEQLRLANLAKEIIKAKKNGMFEKAAELMLEIDIAVDELYSKGLDS